MKGRQGQPSGGVFGRPGIDQTLGKAEREEGSTPLDALTGRGSGGRRRIDGLSTLPAVDETDAEKRGEKKFTLHLVGPDAGCGNSFGKRGRVTHEKSKVSSQ